ncbi:MAG: hypothetical protein ACRDDI_13365 [Aeromonas veronii]
MSKQVIIGLIGGGKTARREMVKEFVKLNPSTTFDATVSRYYRTPWGRAEQLNDGLAVAELPIVVADIRCLEEAMVIEDAGGFVMHVQGTPTDEVAMTRDSILVSATEQRGRYVYPHTALEIAKQRLNG